MFGSPTRAPATRAPALSGRGRMPIPRPPPRPAAPSPSMVAKRAPRRASRDGGCDRRDDEYVSVSNTASATAYPSQTPGAQQSPVRLTDAAVNDRAELVGPAVGGRRARSQALTIHKIGIIGRVIQ